MAAPILSVGGVEIPYSLRRSPTATRARLTMTPGRLQVVVPEVATKEQIDGVLERRKSWVVTNWRKMEKKSKSAPSIARFATGAKIPFRGRMMRLVVEPGTGSFAEVEYRNGFQIRVPAGLIGSAREAEIATALRLWLKQRVRRDVLELVRRHGEPNGLRPRGARVKELKHMWGSCGRDRVININWQLVFAPKSVLEYAVIHELAHLECRSHEDAFWAAVAAILPDWQKAKRWLDENEHLLSADMLDSSEPNQASKT